MDNVSMNCWDDLLWITMGKYKMFMSHGKDGIDALTVYLHLMYTARLQGTNSVYAKDIYIRNGIHLGSAKLSKAKALLYGMGLIKTVERRDESGKIIGKYIEVVTKTVPSEQEIHNTQMSVMEPQHSKSSAGFQETNALTNNIKCLNEKNKHAFGIIRKWFEDNNPDYYHGAKHSVAINNMIQRFKDLEKIISICDRYKTKIYSGEKYWRELPLTPAVMMAHIDSLLKEAPPEKRQKTFRERNPFYEGIEELINEGKAVIDGNGNVQYLLDDMDTKEIEYDA